MNVPNGAFTRTYGFGQSTDDERTIARFHMESVPDPIASEREGRPIHRLREEVEIITPGNGLNIPNEIVTDVHRNRWPKQYAAFKAGYEISPEGTPLEMWHILNKAQIQDLKAMNLHTVEHIRDMSDHVCQRMMGGMRLRALAAAYLDEAAHTALLSQMTAENERKAAQIAELNHKVEELSTLLSRVHGEMQAMKDAPSPLATAIPGMMDPIEAMKTAPVGAAASSFADLPEPRKRGRPPLPRDAAGNPIREGV